MKSGRKLVHGTSTGYKYGCRCKGCKAAHAEAWQAFRITKGGRPRNKQVRAYMDKYGVTAKQVRQIGVEALDRMTEDARVVMFSTHKWDVANPHWRLRRRGISAVFGRSKPYRPEFGEKPWEPGLIIWEAQKPVESKRQMNERQKIDEMVRIAFRERRAA